MNLTSRIVFLLTLTTCVLSLNILAVLPYQGKSHFFVFKELLQEIAKRGHNLTVISHFPNKNPMRNYHDISLAGTLKIIEDELPVERSLWTVIQCGMYLSNTGIENCDVMLQNKHVLDMVGKRQKFDVVLVEQFNSDCGLGLAHKLDAPVVAITSHILMPWHYNRMGIPDNPAYVSFHFLEGGTKPTLYQKIERVVLDVYFKLVNHFLTQRENQNSLEKYLGGVPPLEELARNIKFVLLYHNFVLTGSRLFPANVIEVGGYHVGQSKPLTGDLKQFVDDSEHGIIYISFGSVVKSSTLPADKLAAILEAMEEFPQRFIWKWEDKALLTDRKNLYVSNWLPQIDILAHPKTVAFFSHAGMLGTTEAIHFGVPMVAMPIVGDQPANAAAVEESGLGVQIQIRNLNKENLVAAFKNVLDPEFQQKVKDLSKAWHDRPLSSMDSAIFWTEFAARQSNFTFRTAAADVPLYQSFNLDVIFVFLICIIVIVYLPILLCCKGKSEEAKNKTVRRKSKRH